MNVHFVTAVKHIRMREDAYPQARVAWIISRLNRLLPTLFVVYAPTLTLLAMLAIVTLQTGIRVSDLTRDPVSVMDVPLYTGLLSNIGILLWSFTAAICLFSHALLRKNTDAREWSSFLLLAGLLTSLLLLDDLFLLHERLFPDHFHIPQNAVLAGYVLITALYVARFKTTILKTDFLLLLFAFGFFGLSLLIDVGIVSVRGSYFFEDGLKLFGIVSWFAYFARVCVKRISCDLEGKKSHRRL